MIFNRYLLLFVFFLQIHISKAQTLVDSLTNLLNTKIADTSRVLIYDQLAFEFMNSKSQIALKYAQDGLKLAQDIKFLKGQARNLNRLGSIFRISTNFAKSLEMHLKAIEISKKINDNEGLARNYNNLGILYAAQTDFRKALYYSFIANKIAQSINNESITEATINNIGGNYARLNMLDSALFFAEINYKKKITPLNISLLANIYNRNNNAPKALYFYNLSISMLDQNGDLRNLSLAFFEIAQVYKKINRLDSCLFYAKKSLALAERTQNFSIVSESSSLLAKLYEKENPAKALSYFKTSLIAKDSVFNLDKYKQMGNLELNERLRLEELAKTQNEFDAQKKYLLLLSLLGILFVVTIIQFRNNKQKQAANKLLNKQKIDIESQKMKLHESLETVKATQLQLIQQEKLASLGELTAGIAHEIQNPLNFVNNFSELSTELVTEMKDELAKITIASENKDNLFEILDDLALNQQKIHHHGVRASNIVKGMLDHSRKSTSEKSKINLNTLAEEYLRLSYLGTRSKIVDFNADYQFKQDAELPNFYANSQDISRVVLNLINNAFYAVWDRVKYENKADNFNYKPKVTVYTQSEIVDDKMFIILKVEDNGLGIKEEVKNKIFQPFFTTKPTGEGTGLGLSISYDIVVKGHNGVLMVESELGKGTIFTMKLPC